MRSRKGGCLGNHDMGVNIDRGGRGPARGAIGIMDTGGGTAVAILAVDHEGEPVADERSFQLMLLMRFAAAAAIASIRRLHPPPRRPRPPPLLSRATRSPPTEHPARWLF